MSQIERPQGASTTPADYESIASDAIKTVSQPVPRKLHEASKDAAVDTLLKMGYTYFGKAEWKPPAAQAVEPATCEECGGDGIVLASQNQWACQTCSESAIAQPVAKAQWVQKDMSLLLAHLKNTNFDVTLIGEMLEFAVNAAKHSAQPVQPAEPDMPSICAALGFDPTNHHNAARCPYCTPTPIAQPPVPCPHSTTS